MVVFLSSFPKFGKIFHYFITTCFLINICLDDVGIINTSIERLHDLAKKAQEIIVPFLGIHQDLCNVLAVLLQEKAPLFFSGYPKKWFLLLVLKQILCKMQKKQEVENKTAPNKDPKKCRTSRMLQESMFQNMLDDQKDFWLSFSPSFLIFSRERWVVG